MGEDRLLKYYSDFGKCLSIEYNNCNDMQIEKIDFWIKKFTPSVEEISGNFVDYYIYIDISKSPPSDKYKKVDLYALKLNIYFIF